jgi:hypothetical protein
MLFVGAGDVRLRAPPIDMERVEKIGFRVLLLLPGFQPS